MEKELQLFLTALGDIHAGLDKYQRGQRREGKSLIDNSLQAVSRVSQTPEWGTFFADLNAYFSTLEMADLGYVQNIAASEAGFLKHYGLRGPDILRLATFYRQQRAHTDAEAVFSIFADPATLVQALKAQLDGILKGIDASRSLPRRLKKKTRKLLTHPVTHFLAGTMLILGNLFWLKNMQASVSVGTVFIGSAVKAKKSEKEG